MQFRLIEQETNNAAMNMAIDESIYESVAHNKQLPTIRFYKWENNSISLGAFQNQNEINLEECKKNNVEVVRRITGGRAVYHDKVDFTYSVVTPIKIFDNNVSTAYREICSWIINSLKDLGIKSKLENKNDVIVNGKKISGNAAKLMEKGVYLQHGTLIYDIDFELMPKVLNISKGLAKEKIASILEFKKIDNEKVYESLKNNFAKNNDIVVGKLSEEEVGCAALLSRTKYNSIETDKDVLLKGKGVCYALGGN